jgi:hypothetical protein
MRRKLEDLKKGFLQFGDTADGDGEVLYKKISEIIINSEYLLKIADNVPLGQPFANIFFGGVHLLLLKEYKHKLSDYYSTIQSNNEIKPIDNSLKSIFIDFVKQYQDEIIEICKTKKVQTNEIGRCSFLIPGLNYIFDLTKKPLVLLELGTSAGLLLNYDKYGINYLNQNQITGDPNSEVQLECAVMGDVVPPIFDLPKVKKKIGIDLYPVNCRSSDESLWLLSLVWPKHIKRFNSLEKALNICKSSPATFELIAGDGFRNIENYLSEYGESEFTLCIYHSFAINQISKEEQDEYYDNLKAYTASNNKRIFELRVNWLPDSKHQLVLNEISDGEISTTELANIHHHGRWIEWLVFNI